jgi:class 3 adenylate cyclase/tetratricopeptide (TPR) repeat protein
MGDCPRCGRAAAPEANFCAGCGMRLAGRAASAPHARKTVTILFADVSGFTALGERLDPESLEQVMARYFAAMRAVVERHGGTVEKFIGDGFMVVFGVPVVHEDDALRAARAALEMRAALEPLNEELGRRWDVHLRTHTGINTGEVVVGESFDGQPLTLGDTVNVAQRLESAAGPSEILVGPATARLLRDAARLTPVEPLQLKGKATPIEPWRLHSIGPDRERAHRPADLVGRRAELCLLRDAFDGVVASRRPALVTVVGPAGIGKSRLSRELTAAVAERATVLVGRCLPYGEGITYWPLAEVVRRLTGFPDEAAIAALAAPDPDAQRIAARVARVAGFEPGGVTVEESHWAVRRLLEIRAAQHPVIVVIDDVHWAEPTLLDLLDHVWTYAGDVPLMAICNARPELLERRPDWGDRGTVVPLGPLADAEAAALLDQLGAGAGDDERARVLATAEGNPFFLEQVVAMRAEPGRAGAGPPDSIQALLAARIDGLPPPERAVIEVAAVEGRTFHLGAAAELLGHRDPAALDALVDALVRRQLIRPSGGELPGERGYRFAHILIRDVAYGLIPKTRRADLHERFAGWLERRAGSGHAEIVGHHLEQAHRCHAELRPRADAERRPLDTRAAEHLGGAGRSALGRGDLPAGVNLLERAAGVLAPGDAARGRLLPDLGMALVQLGRLPRAERVLADAAREAAERDDEIAGAHALTARFFAHVQVDSEAATADFAGRFERFRATFEDSADDLGLARLWHAQALVHWLACRSADAETAWTRAVRHARRAGDEQARADALVWLASAARDGPTPVPQALARCKAILEQLHADRRSQALTLRPLASLHAMSDRPGEARELIAAADAIVADLGMSLHAAGAGDAAFVALLAGDTAGAEAALRVSYAHLEEMGERALLASTAALLGRTLCAQGRDDEALTFAETGLAAAAGDDLAAQIVCREVRAEVLARRGDLGGALALSGEAVALANRTDLLSERADALMVRADVLRVAGEPGTAGRTLRDALALYERKGNVVGARRARVAAAGVAGG